MDLEDFLSLGFWIMVLAYMASIFARQMYWPPRDRVPPIIRRSATTHRTLRVRCTYCRVSIELGREEPIWMRHDCPMLRQVPPTRTLGWVNRERAKRNYPLLKDESDVQSARPLWGDIYLSTKRLGR